MKHPFSHALGGVAALLTGLVVLDYQRAGTPVIELVSQELDEPAVTRGETFTARYRLKALKSCPVRVERVLVDGAGVVLPLAVIEAQDLPIERTETVVEVVMPLAATPGEGGYRVTAVYRCPWLFGYAMRDVPLTLPELALTIVPREQDKAAPDDDQ